MKHILLNHYKHIALQACLVFLFGIPVAATAQGAEQGAAPSKDGASPAGDSGRGSGQVDDKTKEKFVDAYIKVKGIQKKYTQKLHNMEDIDQARRLQKQVQAEMVKVVEDSDMSVQEYNEVVDAISSDPELRMEIEKMAQGRTK